MDNISDPDISFDEKGISNYFYQYKDIARSELGPESGRAHRGPDDPKDQGRREGQAL